MRAITFTYIHTGIHAYKLAYIHTGNHTIRIHIQSVSQAGRPAGWHIHTYIQHIHTHT